MKASLMLRMNQMKSTLNLFKQHLTILQSLTLESVRKPSEFNTSGACLSIYAQQAALSALREYRLATSKTRQTLLVWRMVRRNSEVESSSGWRP